MTVLESKDIITTAIDDLGESITVTSISASSFNDYGDVDSETTTTPSITVFIRPVSQEEILKSEGILLNGDLIVYFESSDVSYAVEGNRFSRGSITYRIESTSEYPVTGTKQMMRAIARRV